MAWESARGEKVLRSYTLGYLYGRGSARDYFARYKVARALLDQIMGRTVCPFCRRRFRSFHGLRTHLATSECGDVLTALVKEIVNKEKARVPVEVPVLAA